MEFPISYILALFHFIIFLLIATKKSKSNPAPNLPPGPPKLPMIGNLHQLFGSLPHQKLRDLAKKYGPLMHLKLGEISTIVVSSPEIAKEVFKNHDIVFAQRPHLSASKIMSYNFEDIGFAPCGNYWRQLRKICIMELFNSSRVQSFRFVRLEEVSNLVKTIHSNKGSTINLSEKIFSFTYGMTSRLAFGKKCTGQDSFLKVFSELTKLPAGLSMADLYPSVKLLHHISSYGNSKLEKMHQEADKILQDTVDEHRQRRRTKNPDTEQNDENDDLIDVLLKLQEQGKLQFSLTDNTIKAVLSDIVFAGSESSSTTMEWAMSEMLKNPRVMKEAQKEVREALVGKQNANVESSIHELKYLKSIIKETLRLHPSLPLLLPRESNKSCEFLGYEIPEKTQLIVNAFAIGRDQKHWSEPDKFKPERFFNNSIDYKGTDIEFIPFGAGRRVCPAISYAMAGIELPLAKLLYHFDWSLPNGLDHEGLDMCEASGLTVRRKNDLILIPTPVEVC